jgi:hypothetical protein
MADDRYEMGRLSFVVRPAKGAPGEGDQPLGLDAPRDGVLYGPETAEPGAPLLIFLHGAMGAGHAHLRAVLAAVRPIRRDPGRPRLTRADLGPHRRALLGRGCHQRLLGREVPVERPDADAGTAGHFVYLHLVAPLAEQRPRRVEHPGAVALGVSTRSTGDAPRRSSSCYAARRTRSSRRS